MEKRSLYFSFQKFQLNRVNITIVGKVDIGQDTQTRNFGSAFINSLPPLITHTIIEREQGLAIEFCVEICKRTS